MINDFFAVISAVVIGYIMGRFSRPEKEIGSGFQKLIYKGREIAEDLSKPSMRTGVIPHKTATEMNLKNEPPAVREGKEEMKKTLEQIPDIENHRQMLVRQANGK